MGTVSGSGASTAANTATAAKQATQAARARLAGARASFGFVFAGPEHDLASALITAREIAGCGELVGCTTAGELTAEGLLHNGLVVMLVATDTMTSKVALAKGMKDRPRAVVEQLASSASDLKRVAASKDHRHLTSVLLTDGLAGTGESVVLGMQERLQTRSQIVGGAAGDEAAFRETRVGAGAEACPDSAAALHVFAQTPWGIGVNHGLRSTTKPMRVTKAVGNVVHEIEGAPAFDAYRKHARERGISIAPATAGAYMIGNELGIHFFDKINRARAPLSVGQDGSLSCAAAIPEGAMVSILDGDPSSMIDAARSAAEEAREHLGDAKAAGVLLFDCVCRGMILKEKFQSEIDAVRSVFGDVPVAGFLTYGEIARYRGRLDGWHNATAVVAAIPA